MDASAFQTTIDCFGFNKTTQNILLQPGFTMTIEFASLPVTELPKMLKNLACGTVPANINYSYLPYLHLCGFHAWIDYCLMCGQEPDAGSYLGAVMDCWIECVTDLSNANEAMDDVKHLPA